MCGRTACTLAPDEFPKRCKFRGRNGKVQSPHWRKGSSTQYHPHYNVAPQAHTPVIISTKHVPSSELENGEEDESSERTLQAMKWGLIPSWFKGEPGKFEYKMSNARSDTLMDKASYKTPLVQGKRCVVLAEGFYEWKTDKGGKKQPYYIYFKSKQDKKMADETSDGDEDKPQLLTMAGLFDCWKSKDQSGSTEILYSYAIITVDASESMKWLHHRMPAVLDGEEAIRQWLEQDVPYKKALQLLTSVNCLDWHPVSSAMNNSRHNGPDCIKPIDLTTAAADSKKPTKGAITSWFVKSPKKEDTTQKETNSPAPVKTKERSKPLDAKPGTITSFFTKSPKKETKEEPGSPSAKKRKLE